MKPPTSKDSVRPPLAGETQVIDVQDVELVLAAQEEAERSLPPPLPPEIRASHVPLQPPAHFSQPPGSYAPSYYPPAAVAPPPRSTTFYLVALLVFLVVGVGGGVVVARTLRKPSEAAAVAAPAPKAKPQATVITIGTVEVDDDPDGGK